MVNPCIDKLSDIEYLEHMIPHHQVAIDVSNMLIPNTNNPTMLHLCRNIVRKQGYEIWEMTMMKKRLVESPFVNEKGKIEKTYTKLDKYNPIKSKSKEGSCNPMFFKPNNHMKHMNMKMNIKGYLEHMKPHHQVAVDMSKRLLLHTKNSYLIDFCKKLIFDQQTEIKLMNDLGNSNFYYSELLGEEVIFN